MKLTRKLSLAIGLGILLVLGVQAWTRVVLDQENYRADVGRDHAVLGETIALIVEMLWRTDGARRALEAVEHQNSTHSHITIRWVELDAPPSSGDVPLRPELVVRAFRGPVHEAIAGRPVASMLTYVPVDVPGRLAAIELLERLDGERDAQRLSLLRAALTTTALVILCFVITLGFGAFFVARPLRLLVEQAEAVGAGMLDGQVEIRQDDEIRDLARAFETMVTRLKAARDSEQRAVAARISALEQLRHSDRLRAIGEIASAIAHEVGTPLNVVRARGSMIASGEIAPTRMRELGTVVVEQVDRISVTIRSLLDYARREPSQRADTSLTQLVKSVVGLVDPLARERGVELSFSAPEAVARSFVDPAQIQQAITNLVINAIQATAAGGHVDVDVRTDADGALRIEVRDDGCGMDAEVLEHAFDPFFTTKSAGLGTGLGLSIAREIAREHGGSLTLESGVDRGTRAVLTVPPATAA